MINDIKARQVAHQVALDNVSVDRKAYHKARIERDFYASEDIEYLLKTVERLRTTVYELLTFCDTDDSYVKEYTDAAHKLLDELEEKKNG